MQRRRAAFILAVLALLAIGERRPVIDVRIPTTAVEQVAHRGAVAATTLGPIGISLVLSWNR